MKKYLSVLAFIVLILAVSCGSPANKWKLKQSYYGFKPGSEWSEVSNNIAKLVKDGTASVAVWVNRTSLNSNISLQFFLDNPDPSVMIVARGEGIPSEYADKAAAKKLTLRFVRDTATTNYYLAYIDAELSDTADVTSLERALSNKSIVTGPLVSMSSSRRATLYNLSQGDDNLTAVLSYYRSGGRVISPTLGIVYGRLTNEMGK